MSTAAPGRRALLGLSLALCVTACEPRGRPGARCAEAADCAWGLVCVDEHCHHTDDRPAHGVRGVIRALPRRDAPPRSEGDVPPLLIEFALRANKGVLVEVLTGPVLPDVLAVDPRNSVSPGLAVARFAERVEALAKQVSGVKLRRSDDLGERDARAIGLGVLRTGKGAPVIAGVRLSAGEQRHIVPILTDPAAADRELGAALWALDLRRQGRLPVGFVCAGGAFCPRSVALPAAPGGAWPAPVEEAFRAVYAPFDDIRRDLLAELSDLGLQPVAVDPGAPPPPQVHVLVLAAPLAAVSAETVRWLADARASGTAVITLLGGARFVASASKVAAVEAGATALLAPLQLTVGEALLADRAALVPFRAPSRLSTSAVPLPLAAEVFRVADDHPAVAGLRGLVLPLSGSLEIPRNSTARALLMSRPAVSPVALPTDASTGALERSAPVTAAALSRVLAATVAASAGAGPAVVVASGLGVESMSAQELLANLQLDGEAASSPANLLRRLGPYAVAATAYLDTLRANRALRARSLALLRRLIEWSAVPARIRAIPDAPGRD